MQLDAADAVAEIDERGAGIGADDAVRPAEVGDAGVAGECVERLPRSSGGLEARRAVGGSTRRLAGGEEASTARADGQPRDFMRPTVRATPAASHISKGPSLPVEAGAHGGVDGGGVVCDFANAVGGVVPEDGEKRPEEGGGLVFCGIVGEQAGAGARQRGGILRHLERGQSGFGGGTIFEGGEIEDQAQFFAVGATRSFCRSLGWICRRASRA